LLIQHKVSAVFEAGGKAMAIYEVTYL